MTVIATPRRFAGPLRLWLCPTVIVAFLFAVAPAWSDTAGVQYVSAATVYLDVGVASGLQQGTEVRVIRSGQIHAVLVVDYVAQHSAACRVVSGGDVRVGDRVAFDAEPSNAATHAESGDVRDPLQRGASRSVWSHVGHMRGRVAAFYTHSAEPDGTYQNPAVTALMRWVGSGQKHLSLRLRGDRPTFDFSDEGAPLVLDAARVRLFEARVRYRSTNATVELEGGRFLPANLEGMGSLDGGSFALRATHALRFGAAVGRSVTNGVRGFASPLGSAYGGFVALQQGRRGKRWSALASWTILQDPDVTRRQFGVLRGDAMVGAVRFFQRFEVDVNPQWKRELGEGDAVVSAWTVGNEVRFRKRSSLALSVDSRRPILLPEVRDSVDNLHLERSYGARASLRLGLGRHQIVRGGGRYGWRQGSNATTRSWDVALVSSRLMHDQLSASVRVDSHNGGSASSAHVSANLRFRPAPQLGFVVAGGAGRRESQAVFIGTSRNEQNMTWIRLGADLRTSRGLWFDIANEWQGVDRGHELALTVGRVF